MIDVGVLITGIIGIITTTVSSWVSWVFAKRKYNSEVDSILIENMKESLEFYKKLSDDNRERLEEAFKRNEHLEQRNNNLEREIEQLRNQIMKLMDDINTLKSNSITTKTPRKSKAKSKVKKDETTTEKSTQTK